MGFFGYPVLFLPFPYIYILRPLGVAYKGNFRYIFSENFRKIFHAPAKTIKSATCQVFYSLFYPLIPHFLGEMPKNTLQCTKIPAFLLRFFA